MAVTTSRTATATYREQLIESLGDRMCSSGPGPMRDEIDTLSCLEEAQQRAFKDYLLFLVDPVLPAFETRKKPHSNDARRA